MMKASTRLDSSHEQRRRRGAPGMNKGERRWVESRVGCRELEGGGDKAGQGGSCESLVSGLIVLSLKLTVWKVGRELEGGGDKAGQGGGCESLVSGLIFLSLKLTVCCSKRADATADLSGAIEAGNKEDFEKYSKRTVKTQSFSVNSLVLLLDSAIVLVCVFG
ncbi:hypothetical protein DY000_02040058 [Brassica cretica]|uniref:Uncharacterized protein n=1 Tax=Brassica cretica TaxID=69181 RepID=A0ABQ7BHD5_BRACR|nr:hypothetical protein DY000_02040058 [Brassica cretica]